MWYRHIGFLSFANRLYKVRIGIYDFKEEKRKEVKKRLMKGDLSEDGFVGLFRTLYYLQAFPIAMVQLQWLSSIMKIFRVRKTVYPCSSHKKYFKRQCNYILVIIICQHFFEKL